MPLASPASEPAGKHPDAFRTISEVAEDLAVPQHVLRFWESRFGQIRPLKRAGGRRFYRPQDVELVAGIRHLLHVQRYTIEGAQRVLKENGVRFVQAVGRGEAVVAAPQDPSSQKTLPHDSLPRDAASRGVASGAAGTSISGDAPAETRALLRDLLAELNACRDALSALRRPPDDPA